MIFSASLFSLFLQFSISFAQAPCLDLSRDCERRKDLCGREEHSDAMHRSCPKTCNLCNETFSSLSQFAPRRKCEDEASDCEESLELCDNLMFRNLMRKQCAFSCGFCRGGYQPTTTKKPRISKLVKSKKRGRSKSLIDDEEEEEEDEISIIDVMKLIRGAEHGHTSTTTTTTTTSTSTTSTTTTTTSGCKDRAIDCQAKAGLCEHKNYQTLMRRVCKKTCSYC